MASQIGEDWRMGQWHVDGKSELGLMTLVIHGILNERECYAFYVAHNAAVDAFGNSDYRVFCDLRQQLPMSPEATVWMEKAKAYSAQRPNFRGSAVLIARQVIAMQHRRTSAAVGIGNTELVTDDEAEARAYLKTVYRSS
jgi:hypothetical protein